VKPGLVSGFVIGCYTCCIVWCFSIHITITAMHHQRLPGWQSRARVASAPPRRNCHCDRSLTTSAVHLVQELMKWRLQKLRTRCTSVDVLRYRVRRPIRRAATRQCPSVVSRRWVSDLSIADKWLPGITTRRCCLLYWWAIAQLEQQARGAPSGLLLRDYHGYASVLVWIWWL